MYLRHSLRLIGSLFAAGRSADFLPLSNLTHMVPDPLIRTRLEERIVTYFHTHLTPPDHGAKRSHSREKRCLIDTSLSCTDNSVFVQK